MRLPATFSSLTRHRNYRLWFGGQLASYCGNFVQDATLPWLVLTLTGSPLAAGLIVFCRVGPFLVGGLYGGVIADRFDNQRVLMAAQTFAMLVSLALAAVAFSGTSDVWPYYVLALFAGVALVFDSPNRHALVYQLVGRNELQNAVALNQGFQNTGRVLGPAIAGLLIATVGAGWCFVVNAVSFLVLLGALAAMRRSEFFSVARDKVHRSALHAMREGLAYARASRDMSVVLALAFVLGIFGIAGYQTLLAVFTKTTLDSGSETYGLLWSAYGVGAVVGALGSAGSTRNPRRLMLVGAGIFSVATLALAPVHAAAVAFVLLLIAGSGWSIWTSQAWGHIQMRCPDRLRGRVNSLFVYANVASGPIGGILGGWLAQVGGAALGFAIGGVCCVASVGAATVALRGPERTPEPQPAGGTIV